MTDDQILDVIADGLGYTKRQRAEPVHDRSARFLAGHVLAALRDAGYDVVRVDPDELHQIEFRDDGWTIAHPVKERLDGTLFDCRLNWDGDDPGLRGRYELSDDGCVVLPYGGEECGS